MYEAVFMQEIDASNCLDEEIEGFGFAEHAFFADDKKQVTLFHILEDQVNKAVIFQTGVKAHNVDMFELLLDLNFSLKRFLHFRCLQRVLINFFNRHCNICRFVYSQLYHSVRPFPEAFVIELKV